MIQSVNLSFGITAFGFDLQFFLARSSLLDPLSQRSALVVIVRVISDLALRGGLAFTLALGTGRGTSSTRRSQ